MANENGTETPRSDALGAAESLFGDTAAANETVAAGEEEVIEHESRPGQQGSEVVAKEEAGGDEPTPAENETEQDSQGSEVAEDQTAEGEASPTEDLKVVVSIKNGRATIGVQRPSSDPHVEAFDDPDLSGLTQEVLAVVERARARWEGEPKYPTHERPAPSTRRRGRREQQSAQDSRGEGETEQPQSQTLRLF